MRDRTRAEELLTSAGVGRIVNRAPDTVRLWRRLGKLTPAARTPSGMALYRRRDAERLRRTK